MPDTDSGAEPGRRAAQDLVAGIAAILPTCGCTPRSWGAQYCGDALRYARTGVLTPDGKVPVGGPLCACACHDVPDTGALGPTGDLDAPGDSAGGGVLWPASMGSPDYEPDYDPHYGALLPDDRTWGHAVEGPDSSA